MVFFRFIVDKTFATAANCWFNFASVCLVIGTRKRSDLWQNEFLVHSF
jgi:hypothetical protein